MAVCSDSRWIIVEWEQSKVSCEREMDIQTSEFQPGPEAEVLQEIHLAGFPAEEAGWLGG